MEILEKVEVEIVVTKGQFILVYVPKHKKDFFVHFLIKKVIGPKGIPYGFKGVETKKKVLEIRLPVKIVEEVLMNVFLRSGRHQICLKVVQNR